MLHKSRFVRRIQVLFWHINHFITDFGGYAIIVKKLPILKKGGRVIFDFEEILRELERMNVANDF